MQPEKTIQAFRCINGAAESVRTGVHLTLEMSFALIKRQSGEEFATHVAARVARLLISEGVSLIVNSIDEHGKHKDQTAAFEQAIDDAIKEYTMSTLNSDSERKWLEDSIAILTDPEKN